MNRDQVTRVESRIRSETCGTVKRFNRCMKEVVQAGPVVGKSMRDEATNFLSLTEQVYIDNKHKLICSCARGMRDANETANGDLL